MSSSNVLKNIKGDLKLRAERVIENLDLKGFTVTYEAATRSLKFKKDLKQMTVPMPLVEREQWADIRQIYRAVFEPGPQVENFSAQNEWSRWTVK